jgi:hypothetical protein
MDRMIELHPDIAFEYLDDGGVLICQLERGDYWQLSAPSGQIWSWIWELRNFDAVVDVMATELTVRREEALATLAGLCLELREREVVVDFRPSLDSAAT